MTDSSKEYKHSYSEISDKRSDIRKRFPGLEHQAFREWPGCENIEEYNALIFGSGDVKAENALILKKSCKSITTIDSDPTAGADHLSLFDVEDGLFDIVIADHVIEHIPISECSDLFLSFRKKLKEKGEIVITIPNITNFGSWFSHYDHKNFSPWWDVAAFLELEGFNIDHIFYWSRRNKTTEIQNFDDKDRKIALFLNRYYGLSIPDFVTIHAIKE